MSTLDCDLILEKMPSQIEDFQQWYTVRLPATCEVVSQCANASGTPQFIKDAEAWENTMGVLKDYAKKLIGEEGDSAQDRSTFNAFVTAAKKIKRASGGEV